MRGNPAWVKGVSGHPGRQKGTANKLTVKAKEELFWLIAKVGGRKEARKLYASETWFKELLWKKFFDCIPKDLIVEGNIDAILRWEENDGDNNGPL